MKEIANLKDYFLSQSISLSWTEFLLKLFFSLVCSGIIAFAYYRYSSKVNTQKRYFYYIILLSIIVTTIIAIIKGSLALSLGMVGALSIVRFRTAIKDPAELIAFFSAITIGITVGADQPLIAFLFSLFVLLFSFIYFKTSLKREKLESEVLVIQVKKEAIDFNVLLTQIYASFNAVVQVKSTDLSRDQAELVLEINEATPEELQQLKSLLETDYAGYSIKFISNLL